MAVSRDDVLTIAKLARLRVDASELDAFTTQMNAILDYVALLDEVELLRAVAGAYPGANATQSATDTAIREALNRQNGGSD